MSADLPEPLTDASVDLRRQYYMPLHINRLLQSETWISSTGDEAKAHISLWCESWRQVPAGSLPDNDTVLRHVSFAGENWPALKERVLADWVRCNDGRLYHPVVCEIARESASAVRKKIERTKKATAARHGHKPDQGAQRDDARNVERNGERDDPRNAGKLQTTNYKHTNSLPEDGPSARSERKYVFQGRIIRLLEADFLKWKEVYSAIPDLKAELQALDDYWAANDPGEKWFHATSGALKKKHDKYLKERPASKAKDPFVAALMQGRPAGSRPGTKNECRDDDILLKRSATA